MEKLRLDLVKESEATPSEVDDEVYEEIEAPKFVDFSLPDCSRPDDRSWFCSRVGELLPQLFIWIRVFDFVYSVKRSLFPDVCHSSFNFLLVLTRSMVIDV